MYIIVSNDTILDLCGQKKLLFGLSRHANWSTWSHCTGVRVWNTKLYLASYDEKQEYAYAGLIDRLLQLARLSDNRHSTTESFIQSLVPNNGYTRRSTSYPHHVYCYGCFVIVKHQQPIIRRAMLRWLVLRWWPLVAGWQVPGQRRGCVPTPHSSARFGRPADRHPCHTDHCLVMHHTDNHKTINITSLTHWGLLFCY